MADTKEFEKIALIHLNSVYRAALAVSGNPATADDLTQATFLKAFEKFTGFREGTNCKAWLMRIMRNTWIDLLRHRKVVGPQLTVDETLVPAAKPPEQTVWSNAEDLLENFSDEQVIQALSELPEDQRLTLYLVDVEQLSHQEVAKIVNVAVGTIKSRSSRARAALKDKLSDLAHDLGIAGRER